MSQFKGLARPFKPDWEAFVAVILRQGTPRRAHHIELFQDTEVRNAIARRFDLLKGLNENAWSGSRLFASVGWQRSAVNS